MHPLYEDIVGLPEEVLNSPMGGMLRPLLEQMTTQVGCFVFPGCLGFLIRVLSLLGNLLVPVPLFCAPACTACCAFDH